MHTVIDNRCAHRRTRHRSGVQRDTDTSDKYNHTARRRRPQDALFVQLSELSWEPGKAFCSNKSAFVHLQVGVVSREDSRVRAREALERVGAVLPQHRVGRPPAAENVAGPRRDFSETFPGLAETLAWGSRLQCRSAS